MQAHQQGQVDHCTGHQQLEARLWPTPITRLSDTSLDEPGDGVLDDLTAPAILPKWWAVLERTGLLQQGFLGMELDRPPALATDTLTPQRTGRTHRRRKHELPATVLGMTQGGADLVGRADTDAALGVDLEGRLGEIPLVHSGTLATNVRPASTNS